MNPWISRHLIYPLGERLTRPGVLTKLDFLQGTQAWPLERIHALQWAKLQSLLHHAYEHVPYYRRLFQSLGAQPGDFQGIEDLSKLPPLTKQDIRANPVDLLAKNAVLDRLKANSTSGSTGSKLQFYNDRNSLDWRSAIKVRNLCWIGCEIGDPVSVLWGSRSDLDRESGFARRLRAVILNRLTLSSFQMSDDKMAKYVSALGSFRPAVLVGYPSDLVIFSNYLCCHGITDVGVKRIVTSGESLVPSQRATIESAFQVPVYNRYGCREFGDVAHECPYHGLHINSERVLVEFEVLHRDEQSVANEGSLRRILITDLDNYGMPFIRYDIGDLGVAGESSPCTCGLILPRIARLDGRSFDIIHAPNGRYIPGTFWTITSRKVPGIDAIQVRQTSPQDIQIAVVPGPDFDTAQSLAGFEQYILQELGTQTRINFKVVDHIPTTQEGKRRFVVSYDAHQHE